MAIVTRKDAFIEGQDTDLTKQVREDNGFDFPTKLIFRTYIAKGLIRNFKHKVVDILPDRDDPTRTVFVFEDSLKLRDDMQKVIKSHRGKMVEKAKEAENMED